MKFNRKQEQELLGHKDRKLNRKQELTEHKDRQPRRKQDHVGQKEGNLIESRSRNFQDTRIKS